MPVSVCEKEKGRGSVCRYDVKNIEVPGKSFKMLL